MIIRVPIPRLRKYDVALYKRGDTYVLHRLITVRDDHYLIRGDNTYSLEHVPDTAVIGVLSSFRYKGTQHGVKDLGYLCYVRIWQAIHPLRLLRAHLRPWAIRIARRMGILPLLKRLLRRGSEA